jgi:hypothetical protein
MKKGNYMKSVVKKLVLLIVVFMAVNLSAKTSSIIGIEGIYNNIDAQEPALGKNYNQSSEGIGIRLGAENENVRFLLIYDIIADKTYNNATVSQYMITGNLDFFIPVNSQKIKPFIGLIFGQAEYKVSSYSDRDNIYGGEAGIELSYEHFSIDVFGRYTATALDKVNHYIQSGIGLNYKF